MRNPYRSGLLFCFLTAMAGGPAAETVAVPIGQQAAELRGMEVPRRGMTKEDVRAGFGTPRNRSQPVGRPPISYWEFDKYYVYFENDRVLHTVFKPTDKEQ